MKITWDTDCDAPCIGRIVAEDGRDHLVQLDWDYPGVAGTFGWNIRHVQLCPRCSAARTGDESGVFCNQGDCDGVLCEECGHDGTDGTIQCPTCGLPPSAFINAAGEWLLDNDGVTVDDPGYFDGEE